VFAFTHAGLFHLGDAWVCVTRAGRRSILLSACARIAAPSGRLSDGCQSFVVACHRSPVIQNLPPVLFTLMKSTEPWSDEYYLFDEEGCLREQGFEHVATVDSDPRHRTVLGMVPRS
jgi:hypothetical protein